ncbi:Putative ribonuclease T2 [Septoria linicola]|uniref:Ribonuclease T2-like n=1 Tax=Septoria linicola TaxID=215465 RepID=A0A9Q9B8U7_9PEZI|nr:putative ribonuclease T2 [Septoria linicola]USW59427.1 Putative ribonuclease T2 [Septoria linicola]
MAWPHAVQMDLTAQAKSLKNITDNMPSVRTLSKVALSGLTAAQSVLGYMQSPVDRRDSFGASATCNSPQLSCQNTTAQSDLCCFNSPGGALLLTQFWDTDPVVGPSDSWTIHGLWPDNCDGTYEANCDDRRAYTNITQILNAAGKQDLVSYMNTYWQSNSGSAETFWEHEWSKHGTCISTLDPDCYTSYQPTEEVPDFFQKVVDTFKTLPTYDWLAEAGITPSTSTTYTLSQLQQALAKNHGGKTPYIGCRSGAVDEAWYFYNVRGSVQTGEFVPVDSLTRSNCPSTGIEYLPKGGSGGSPTSTSTSGGAQPTSLPGEAFSGSGFLNVVTGGSQKGCIISAGTWYTSGTCATITATASGDGFTLKSSKGSCGIVSGALSCGSGVFSTVFTADGNTLQAGGSDTFSADSAPSGSTQVKVYTGSSHSAGVTIQWQSK